MFKIKMKYYLSLNRIAAFTALTVLAIVAMTHPLSAQMITKNHATTQSVQRDMLVSLDKNDHNKILAVTSANVGQLRSIMIDHNDSPASLTGDKRRTFVASTGQFPVYLY